MIFGTEISNICVIKLETCGNGNENQDQPSPNSVLEPQFEDDDHGNLHRLM